MRKGRKYVTACARHAHVPVDIANPRTIDEGDSFASLVYLTFADGRADILGPQGHVDGMCLAGVVPFKMMKVRGRKVKPLPNFGARAAAEVKRFFEDVNK